MILQIGYSGNIIAAPDPGPENIHHRVRAGSAGSAQARDLRPKRLPSGHNRLFHLARGSAPGYIPAVRPAFSRCGSPEAGRGCMCNAPRGWRTKPRFEPRRGVLPDLNHRFESTVLRRPADHRQLLTAPRDFLRAFSACTWNATPTRLRIRSTYGYCYRYAVPRRFRGNAR